MGDIGVAPAQAGVDFGVLNREIGARVRELNSISVDLHGEAEGRGSSPPVLHPIASDPQLQVCRVTVETQQGGQEIPIIGLPEQVMPERYVECGMGEQRKCLPHRLTQSQRVVQPVAYFVEGVRSRPVGVNREVTRAGPLPIGEQDLGRIGLVGVGLGHG